MSSSFQVVCWHQDAGLRPDGGPNGSPAHERMSAFGPKSMVNVWMPLVEVRQRFCRGEVRFTLSIVLAGSDAAQWSHEIRARNTPVSPRPDASSRSSPHAHSLAPFRSRHDHHHSSSPPEAWVVCLTKLSGSTEIAQ